ncbi:hypothetical protein BGW39_008944 [Mortierella sp. 14UC]|nr:hypothetical protein BGW39_008944 [Mortierella sp. 14UC]
MAFQTDQEAQQQLFADTLIKLQIHSALAKERIHHNKSPLPLLAQSCSLLDNLPTSTSSSTTTPTHWTPAQRTLIDALKIDVWTALADACIQASDLIQAEASLQRLATLQDAAAGPFSWRAQKKSKSKKLSNSSNTSVTDAAHSGPTDEHRQAAAGLIQTWNKLRQVHTDMGKLDMANNFGKRIQKMNEVLQNAALPSYIPTTTTP